MEEQDYYLITYEKPVTKDIVGNTAVMIGGSSTTPMYLSDNRFNLEAYGNDGRTWRAQWSESAGTVNMTAGNKAVQDNQNNTIKLHYRDWETDRKSVV